ncbi:MAG: glycosyltransferase family 4 protein [Planctomycetota bacterium]
MRIALVHMRHAHTGGTERYLNHLAAYLAAREHEVTVVCRSHEAPPDPRVRFEVLRELAVGSAWRMWAFARAVERHAAEGAYDVVFGLGKTWTHDAVRLGGGLHGTYLRLAHAETLSRPERLVGKGRLKHRAALRIEARALAPGAYHRVVANSRMVARDVSERYRVPAEALRVIHNGVDLERFHPRHRSGAGAALRAELGLDSSRLVVLFLGTGYGRKGLDVVLAAFAGLARARPEARLVVVGYDSARAAYEAQAERLGLGDAVRFLGGRRDPEACYGAADLYVLPTRYDPFANATLEALASGLPVLTSDANGGAELLSPGAEGEVVPVAGGADALLAGLERWADPDRRAAGARAARALAERHGIDAKLDETLAVLEEVAAAKARGAAAPASPPR